MADNISSPPPKRRRSVLLEGVPTTENERSVSFDAPMFVIIMILLVFGLIMMFSAGYAWAIDEGVEGNYYIKKQLIMGGVGVVGMIIISFIDYHWYMRRLFVDALYIMALGLMVCCFVPGIMSPHNDSRRWIKLAGIEFQPSEVGKFAIIIILAYWISVHYKQMGDFLTGIAVPGGLLGVYAVVLMKQPHFSATFIMIAIAATLMFIGGTKFIHIGITAFTGVLGVAAFMLYKVQSGQLSYIMKRVNSFLYPFNEEYAADTWQTRNSLIAIGSGGFVGMGLGNSRQKFLYLPESKNDFVFAIVCEELGFIGALFVVVLFVFFIIRGFTIAVRATDKAGMLVACGITMHIGIQALLNIAVVSNAIPNTGVSLPFFSYGGTALIMQLCEMGVLLNISRHVVQIRPDRRRRENMQNAPETVSEP